MSLRLGAIILLVCCAGAESVQAGADTVPGQSQLCDETSLLQVSQHVATFSKPERQVSDAGANQHASFTVQQNEPLEARVAAQTHILVQQNEPQALEAKCDIQVPDGGCQALPAGVHCENYFELEVRYAFLKDDGTIGPGTAVTGLSAFQCQEPSDDSFESAGDEELRCIKSYQHPVIGAGGIKSYHHPVPCPVGSRGEQQAQRRLDAHVRKQEEARERKVSPLERRIWKGQGYKWK